MLQWSCLEEEETERERALEELSYVRGRKKNEFSRLPVDRSLVLFI